MGCAKSDRESSPAGAHAANASPAASALVATNDLPKAANRALIVTIDMSLHVKDVDDASNRIRTAVESAGGYVSNSSSHGGDDAFATMELRVPSDRVSSVRTTLGSVGEITSQSEKVDDVTEQRADLGARLHNARTQEARLLEIMQQKTGSISDLTQAESELARVREIVERLEAEQRTLDGQIALSTIHVTLSAQGPSAWQTPGPSIGHAWTAGVRGAQAIFVYGAIAFVSVAPTLLPIAIFVGLVIVVARRRRNRTLVA
jgi:hypothetical protein